MMNQLPQTFANLRASGHPAPAGVAAITTAFGFIADQYTLIVLPWD
jgi:hypothetical protein